VAHSGESFASDDLLYAPFCLFYGLGVLIQPRLLTAFTNREAPQPGRFKGTALALVILGGAVGIYLSQVVFKDWQSVPLSNLGH
jgi:hypothetical protein